MAVYGKRSRPIAKDVDRVVFLSEDEEEEGPIRDRQTLLPLAMEKLQVPEIKRARRSPKKKVVEQEFEEDITTSPKKFSRWLDLIDMPKIEPAKRSLTEQLMEVPKQTPKQTAQQTPKQTARPSKETPRRSTLSPGKQDIWDELLEDVDTSKGQTMEFKLEENDEDEEEEAEDEEEKPVIVFDYVHETPEFESVMPKPLKGRKTQESSKTYGNERSFLLEEVDKAEAHKEMIRNENDYNKNQEIMTSVDLKQLGRMNNLKEDMQYLIEGLKFNRIKTTIENDNKILIITLCDILASKHDLKPIENVVVDKLLKIFTKLGKQPGDLVIEILILKVLSLFKMPIDKQSEISYRLLTFEKEIELKELNLNDNLKNNLHNLVLEDTNKLAIDLLSIQSLNWSIIEKIIPIHAKYSDKVLALLQQYFDNGKPILNQQLLDSFLSQGINNKQSVFLQLIITIANNYELDEITYKQDYVKLIINEISTVPSRKPCSNKFVLFGSGYLVNYVKQYPIAQTDLVKLIPLINFRTNNEELNHMIGYIHLVLDIQSSLPIDSSKLQPGLANFKLLIQSSNPFGY
ncbi:hypothetical protein HYPBUDRAFT_147231 [Hyphopichia burtonii NRRL Y-1933]|uniref:Uncharacterized protein n=1 Tax=Hyphopichia burtonii NRRL Y-1933 TaxID=984485 RepID=A0A1E4RN32_9ASCO|nr:hypothetical protein HYPBUDRAFT_147231 [Hyphopichia burtonii NRRL Y-1933]ODV68688.1 hypothetical protein HYPBUDRAFT_147231 [Hyphopichia burtonii NRRL Y-1933]